jgi:hypothetical protein
MTILLRVQDSGQHRDRAQRDEEEEAADHLVWRLSSPPSDP